jgi:hypothetical protein
MNNIQQFEPNWIPNLSFECCFILQSGLPCSCKPLSCQCSQLAEPSNLIATKQVTEIIAIANSRFNLTFNTFETHCVEISSMLKPNFREQSVLNNRCTGSRQSSLFADFLSANSLIRKIRGPKWQNVSTANNEGNLYYDWLFFLEPHEESLFCFCKLTKFASFKSLEVGEGHGPNLLTIHKRVFLYSRVIFAADNDGSGSEVTRRSDEIYKDLARY